MTKRVPKLITITGDFDRDFAAAVKQGLFLKSAKPRQTDLNEAIEFHNQELEKERAARQPKSQAANSEQTETGAKTMTTATQSKPEVTTTEAASVTEKSAVKVETLEIIISGNYGIDRAAAVACRVIDKKDRPKYDKLKQMIADYNEKLKQPQDPTQSVSIYTSAPIDLDLEQVLEVEETKWHWQEQGDIRCVLIPQGFADEQSVQYRMKGYIAMDEETMKRKITNMTMQMVTRKSKTTSQRMTTPNTKTTSEKKVRRAAGTVNFAHGLHLSPIGSNTSMASFVRMLQTGPKTIDELIAGSDLSERELAKAKAAVPKRLKRISSKGYGFEMQDDKVVMLLPENCQPLFSGEDNAKAKKSEPEAKTEPTKAKATTKKTTAKKTTATKSKASKKTTAAKKTATKKVAAAK